MNEKRLTTEELEDSLREFYGTEHYYRHWLARDLLMTDGVTHFAANAGNNGAFWLIDIIATEVFPLLKKEPFLHIQAHVISREANLTAGDGNGNTVWSRHIDYTDMQEGTWRFYLTDNVLLLPSEY